MTADCPKSIVLTGERSPSLLTHWKETVPVPPVVVTSLENVIFTGQPPVWSAGLALRVSPTTWNAVDDSVPLRAAL